jgi:hypothetical protein
MTVLDVARPTPCERTPSFAIGAPGSPGREAEWLGILPRLALFTAVAFSALFFVIIVVIGFDDGVPFDYAALMQAGRAQGAYRLFSVLDMLVWLGIGATLLAWAGTLWQRARVRAAFIGGCAYGQLLGALGGSLRLNAVADLGARYASATPDVQAALLPLYLTVDRTINAHFSLGAALYGVAFLLIASVAVGLVGFPRWLAAWFGISGLVILLENVMMAAAMTPPAVLGIGYLLVGVLGLHAAVAIGLWHVRAGLMTAVAPARAIES